MRPRCSVFSPWRKCVLALVLIGVMCPAASAWGPEGHRITGRIAESYLNESAKKAVDELLGGRSLADVSVWADDVRQQDAYRWTAPLHYVNTPRDAQRINMRRDCEDGLCVIGAIHHFADILQNTRRDRSRTEQREALKFIVHFIGDLHQPMHVSYRDDRGGNLLRVSFVNNPSTNLHRVWDTDMIRLRLGEDSWPKLADEILAKMNQESITRWRRARNPVDWANESLEITRRIYAELPRTDQLGREYYERNIDDVLSRLAMAGLRIADLLNELLADGVPAAAGDDGGRDSDDAPASEDVRQHLRLVDGESCGRGDGRLIYLENTHPTRIIRANIQRTWTTPTGDRTAEQTVVVRPGEDQRQRLGCSEQPAGRNEIRRFRWQILSAEFR